jgi:hypothetical protein
VFKGDHDKFMANHGGSGSLMVFFLRMWVLLGDFGSSSFDMDLGF